MAYVTSSIPFYLIGLGYGFQNVKRCIYCFESRWIFLQKYSLEANNFGSIEWEGMQDGEMKVWDFMAEQSRKVLPTVFTEWLHPQMQLAVFKILDGVIGPFIQMHYRELGEKRKESLRKRSKCSWRFWYWQLLGNESCKRRGIGCLRIKISISLYPISIRWTVKSVYQVTHLRRNCGLANRASWPICI